MSRVLIFFLVSFLLFFASACSSHKDDSLEKAIFTYTIACSGGSLTACRSSCLSQCSVASETDPITNATYPCVRDCQASCDTNCDLTSILLLLSTE